MNQPRPVRPATDSNRIRLNTDWRFGGEVPSPGNVDLLDLEVARQWADPSLDDTGWTTVTLPHTVVPLSWKEWNPRTWEAVWAYRRPFATPDRAPGSRVFVDFEAAMTTAVVSVNGTVLGQHRGGYLPFSFEVTGLLTAGDNTLGVLLDARAHQNLPPNLPSPASSASIDYWQPGGIHRDVWLRVVPASFIAAIATTHHDVLDPAARRSTFVLTVDCAQETNAALTVRLVDDSGAVVAQATRPPERIAPGSSEHTIELTGLADVRLWDIDAPVLYTVEAELATGNTAVHTERLRTGYREARWEPDGFYLNGDRRYLFGVNRHELYPFAGFAMSDRVQRHDAEIISRELNCNFVRCSHYPQTAAFLDACDELGVLVWEEPPGWQYVGDQDWQDVSVENITDMIARDRHRPSVVIWAARLNETPDRPAFYDRTEKLVKALDPSRATSGTTHGDYSRTGTFQHDVFSYDDYNTEVDEDGQRHPILLPPVEGRPYLVSEGISSRSSPTSFYRRIEYASVQQHQALDYAYAHNLARADPHHSGIIAWVAFDYQAGFANFYHGLKTGGLGDVFRNLKPGAAFYRSQVPPDQRIVIEPAFTWDPPQFAGHSFDDRPETRVWGPGEQAIICANVERLEVYLGDVHVATAWPDRKRFPHVDYPPFVVDLSLGSGGLDLRIDGYLDDELVGSRRYSGDRAADRVTLMPDDQVLVADGLDATRVVVAIVDQFGQPRGHVREKVSFELRGPGVLLGDNPFDLEDSGAAGAVWIRTLPGQPGDIALHATTSLFGADATVIVSVPDPA